jgi:hypothetical protein
MMYLCSKFCAFTTKCSISFTIRWAIIAVKPAASHDIWVVKMGARPLKGTTRCSHVSKNCAENSHISKELGCALVIKLFEELTLFNVEPKQGIKPNMFHGCAAVCAQGKRLHIKQLHEPVHSK